MTDRQFHRGLSNGAMVTALAGFFWFGLGLGQPAAEAGWWVFGGAMLVQVGVSAWLLRLSFQLRRRSGFTTRDLRSGDAGERRQARRIRAAFAWTTLGQTLLIAGGVWLCVRANRQDLIWPWIGLVVSLHFVPLARVFHVRTYYATALAGGVASVIALLSSNAAPSQPYLGAVMAAIMWSTSAVLLFNVDRVTAQAMTRPWAE